MTKYFRGGGGLGRGSMRGITVRGKWAFSLSFAGGMMRFKLWTGGG